MSENDWMFDLIKFMAKVDETGQLGWGVDKEDNLHVEMDCSDIFMWACADGEPINEDDLPSIRQAYEDVMSIVRTFPKPGPGKDKPTLPDGSDDNRWLDKLYWTELWCSRKRNLRPQGAFLARYVKSDEVRQLFADAGPQRQGEVLGDPVHIDLPQSVKEGS